VTGDMVEALESAVSLRDAWALRNAAAATLVKTEEQVRRLLAAATPEQVIALLESFSPGRSPGPDWTRSLEPLIERLWLWSDPETLAEAESVFRGRGPAWLAIANFLAPDHGARVRAQVRRHSHQSRLPALTIE
jgi:hypothetical protein